MIDDSEVEYVGSGKGQRADPKGNRAVPAPVFNQHPQIDGLDDEPAAHVEPAPRVTPYTKPTGASHPRHAVLAPALRCDEAEHALQKATLELTKATRQLRVTELAEADAEAALMRELPGPTADELLREHVASELKNRAERVAAGLNPDPRAIPAHGKSELDRVAAHRARPVPGSASSLRSQTTRRNY